MTTQKLLLQAAKGQKTSQLPVWLMRQAGRYLPEYQKVRSQHNILTMFKTPSIATEITLQPLKRFPLDGAILYADILLIPDAMGLGLSFVEKEGPQFAQVIRNQEQLKLLKSFEENPSSICPLLSYVAETVSRIKEKLDPHVTLLGFAGAPLTVASYMIEGRGTHGEFLETKKFLFQDPKSWERLMSILTDVTIAYLKMQIEAGAEVVQLFESWSSAIPAHLYSRYCLPYTKKIIQEVSPLAPVILFMGQGASLHHQIKEAAPQVAGVDWRQDLQHVTQSFADTGIALQGNLDPQLLLCENTDFLAKEMDYCLEQAHAYQNGFIFNLGHGCLPQTKIQNIDFILKRLQK